MRLGLVTEMRPHNADEYDESVLWEVVGLETEAQDKARRWVRLAVWWTGACVDCLFCQTFLWIDVRACGRLGT